MAYDGVDYDDTTLVFPPRALLALAVTAVGASYALLLLSKPAINILGYVCGIVLSTTFIASYRAINERRRQNARYSPKPAWSRFAGGVLIAGLLPAAIHLWAFATEVAK